MSNPKMTSRCGARWLFGLSGSVGLTLAALHFFGGSHPVEAAGACRPAPDYLATASEEAIGGIGGTGRTTQPGEGGDGGIGGTGIVGTVTGFASICVNGVEVHYDEAVPVAENGRPTGTASLAVGQVVAVLAEQGKRGLTAHRIEIVHALEGPVTTNQPGRFEVMGTSVHPASTSASAVRQAVTAGDWVQVSGHRNESGHWVATHVAKIAPRLEVTVQGSADADGRFAGVRLTADSRVAMGATQLVRGAWETGAPDQPPQLRIRNATAAPVVQIIERADHVLIETRVRQIREGKINGGHPEFDNALTGRTLREGELVRIRGHRNAEGRLVTERLERQSRRDEIDRTPPENGKRDANRERDDLESKTRVSKPNEGRDSRESRAEERDRNDHDHPERTQKTERTDRNGRNDRPDRIDRRVKD